MLPSQARRVRKLAVTLSGVLGLLTLAACAKTLDGDAGDGNGGSGAGSAAPTCDDYADARGPDVAVRFRNDGAEEIYLSTFCNVPNRPSFTLLRDGSEVRLEPTECEGTCGDAQSDAAPYCPAFDCADLGPLLRIDPGATYEFSWEATEVELSEMPADCYDSSKTAENLCSRRVDLKEGAFVAVGSYVTRVQTPNGMGCPCVLTGPVAGVCEVDKESCYLTGGDQALPEVEVELPSAGVIEFAIVPP
ncbi:MAG: hypothetical protein JNL21_20165 [Myxococcales bacterium]|nr:hypothetical protein [Myxococcales bacterium]